MSQGRTTLDTREGASLQPQGSEHGLSTSYARLERGTDRRTPQHQGPVTSDYMGTSQQFNTDPLGRETLTPRGAGSRCSTGTGSVPPVVTVNSTARTSSRPPSSPFGHLISPRQQYPPNSTPSYRDAALLAAQHGLSAYAPSAAATANRNHTPRAGAKGRPPPAPRPLQHSAPAPNPYQTLGPELLPSCGPGASPSPRRNGMPPSRGGLLFSRGSAPTPSSTHRASDAAAATAAITGHRSSDVATVTVTYNDPMWKMTGMDQQPADGGGGSIGGGGGGSSSPTAPYAVPHALGPTNGTMRVMSPGWGAAQPSVFEADGRPGTRGGGPQYDIEGRPTTRGGQRPPSRAQLNMSLPQPRPPGHVAPLSLGPGWAGLFAGGSGTGPGEAPGPSPTSPRAPSAGAASSSWSGEATEAAAAGIAHRRQPLPLPPAMSGTAAAAAAAAATGSAVGGGGAGGGANGGVVGGGSALGFSTAPVPGGVGGGRGPGVLSALAPTMTAGGHLGGGFASPFGSSQTAAGQVGFSGGGGPGCVGGRPFSPKLSSIAEAPGSPAVSLKGGLLGRLDSATGRKSQEPRPLSTSAPLELARSRDLIAEDDAMSEEGVNDDSYRSKLDQDCSNRGSGRTRPRSTSGSVETTDLQRQHSSNGGNRPGVTPGSTGPSSPTLETPASKPRR